MRVLEVTRSGRSLIINHGTMEGIRPGDKGVFYSSDTIGKHHRMEIARGEAIKVYTNYSFWYLSSIREVSDLKVDKKISLVTLTDANKGRRKYKITDRKVILPGGMSPKSYYENGEGDFPKDLKRGEKDFIQTDRNLTKTETPNAHDKVRDRFFNWVDGELVYVDGLEQNIRFKVLKKNPALSKDSDIQRKVNEEIFDSYVAAVSDWDREKRRRVRMQQPGYAKTGDNTFDRYIETKQREQRVQREALQKVKRDGPLWSAGMNEHELRRYIIESGIQKEVQRQKNALDHLMSHEVIFRYGQGVVSNATAEGEKENLSPRFLSVGYETSLQRISESLAHWTASIVLEGGMNYYQTGEYNVRSEETNFRVGGSYYFWRRPTVIRKFAPFVSGEFKFGRAIFSNSNLNFDYQYQVQSLPALSIGTKYRFHAGDEFNDFINMGLGVNAMLTYERLVLSTAEVLQDDIDESFEVHDIRAQFGFSLYF